jgi:hypothetical protein
MKTVFSLLAVFATIGFAQAGGFGGPPPFTNGSPLISGVDGSYQATARATNLTGVFRFTYSGGRQTSSPQLPTGDTVTNLITDPYNDYVFFVEGLAYRGLVQANVNTSQVAGVFDNGSANVPVWGGEANGLGILSFLSGYFSGKMDQQSPYAAFSGEGEVVVNARETRYVKNPNFNENEEVSEENPEYLETEVIAEQFSKEFKFKGVRASLTTGA